MILSAVLAATLAQSACPDYTRTKVDDDDPGSHCLYWKEATAVEWHVNDQGNPENVNDSEFDAISKAVGSWQAEFASCGSLTLSQGAKTTSRVADFDRKSASNENSILWRFKKCTDVVGPSDGCWKNDDCGNKFDCWQHNPLALAITTTNFDPSTGQILDADVELNTPSFIFTTVDAPQCAGGVRNQFCVVTDIQNTMTHELGHAIGLAHSCQVASTMYASAMVGELGKRVLDPGSKLFVCETYPKGAPARDCVIKTFDGNLGRAQGCGCGASSGVGWAALALVVAWRRRR